MENLRRVTQKSETDRLRLLFLSLTPSIKDPLSELLPSFSDCGQDLFQRWHLSGCLQPLNFGFEILGCELLFHKASAHQSGHERRGPRFVRLLCADAEIANRARNACVAEGGLYAGHCLPFVDHVLGKRVFQRV